MSQEFFSSLSHGDTEDHGDTEERQKPIGKSGKVRERQKNGGFSVSSWNLVFLTWMFLRVSVLLRVSVRKVVGCSSASPRSPRLREKAVGYFFGSGSAELGSSLCSL